MHNVFTRGVTMHGVFPRSVTMQGVFPRGVTMQGVPTLGVTVHVVFPRGESMLGVFPLGVLANWVFPRWVGCPSVCFGSLGATERMYYGAPVHCDRRGGSANVASSVDTWSVTAHARLP